MLWSVNAAAKEFGSTSETITKGLRRNGVEFKAGKKFNTTQIFRALTGDRDAAEARQALARAAHLERVEQEAAGQVIAVSDAKACMQVVLVAIREALLSLPKAYASRCNPGDPVLAREALEGFVDDTLRHCREVSFSPRAKRKPVIGAPQVHRK